MSNTKKGKRKLSTRMKKAIRRTLGGIFLTTAVVVALIPQKETEAAGGTPQVTVSASDSSIPIIDDQDTIYTTGDGMFQFAYVEKGSGGDKVAVIVGYDYERSLDQGVLTIPNTVDAYVKYTHAQGTAGGYVAVGKSGNTLYYPVYRTEIQKQMQDSGEVDENGDPIMEEVEVEVQVVDRYDPCLFSTYEQWYYNEDGSVRDPKDFYYDSKPNSTANTLDEYLPTIDEIYQRIQHATVAYISSQHVVKEGDTWVLDTTPNVGIFSKATNITTLKTGSDLLGIGDYAFYECASLQGIELGDGANTIGNYAFAKCVNLKYANFPTNSSIKALGDHAFYNCRSLEKFTMPVAVTKVGDSAFEGCAGMKEIDLNANGQQVLLQEVGPDVFKNCTTLECLIFPEYFNQEFDISWIEGDTSLKYIKIPNVDMKLVAKDGFSFADLMTQLPEEFYFEGPAESEIHDISKENSYAFKYLDEEIYEKVINAEGSAGSGQSVFRVNNFNELIYFYMDDTVTQIDIPGIIGPYKITVIGSDSFQANHRLTQITIPSTITEIQDNAFKGCHKLKDVIFEEPISLTTIGENAFDTQVIDPILDTCTLDSAPELTFTAPAEEGSAPFDYAMNSSNNINTGSQELTYIKFYTGWPSNLTIQYNPDKGTNELVDYPKKLSDLKTTYTTTNYPYITKENAEAAQSAYDAYKSGKALSQDQIDIINSVLNVTLPTGVQSIKEGIFSGKDANGVDVAGESANTEIKTITMNGLDEIDPYTFMGCSSLIGAYVNGDTSKLGDYAFKDCEKLEDVDILSSLEEYGTRPFKGCDVLSHVEFGNNPNYKCEQAVVYGTSNGSKTSLLEVLQPRGLTYGTGTLTKQELAGISAIAEEAAMDCDGILSADFSESKITELPESVFAETDELYSVVLPDSIRKIAKHAFRNSNIRYLEIPKTLSVIDNSAFEDDPQTITFYCEADSPAADYASNFSNIVVSDKPVTFKVTFYDDDAVTVLDTVEVPAGGNAETHIVPTKARYVFKAWMPNPVGVMEDMKTYATYVPEGEVTYTVQFVDHDDKVLSTQVVPQGGTAVTPVSPERSGYKFTGWRPAFNNVQDDLTIYAQYEKITNDTGSGSSGDGSGSGNGGTGGNGNGSGTNNATLYTLTVVGGSGSGSYASGANAILLADNPPSGKVFDKWVTETQGVTIASASTAATTLTMPASNLTVTATYKDAPSSGNSNNNNGSSNNNGGSTTVITKPNTSVTIDKPGIPNKDSASASVSGSTDNFILKITESAYAKEQVQEALEEEYGDLDDIRYFPMDISLYDSTGTKKVENTDSLRVTVTLPIPEDLVKYAGNNKVGYVVNGKLVKISPKFTTINGVPCITFVAPHFSPYVIYADTSDLSAGTVLDSTPKTGDGIAPKWFLSMGLAAVAVFLFVKKDKKRVAK